jgi:hypothetical protein
MRKILLAAVFCAVVSPALGEIWTVREGRCGEWQSRWDMTQEQSGLWVGMIEYYNVGGPCVRATNQVLRSDARAHIVGENLFAVTSVGGKFCTYVAHLTERRGRGFTFCEGDQRYAMNIRFRAEPGRSVREPEEELFEDEERPIGSGRRFRERGLDDWFGQR